MPRPVKILHCLGALDPGGVETWLMHLLKRLDTKRFKFEFCTFGAHAGLYAAEAEKLGAAVHRCPRSQTLWNMGRRFRQILREGRYDVIHSHVHLFSGILLRWARREGVQIRVAHSHGSHDGKSKTPVRHVYRSLMKRSINRHATHGLAASRLAAEEIFLDWKNDPRVTILHYGIELQPFLSVVNCNLWRKKIGLPAGVPVIGHVGNFTAAKNHCFFLKLAAQIRKHRPDIHFLFIGEGSLRVQIEAGARAMGFNGNIHFLGTRTNVPILLRTCVDAFVFPSLWEGLPVAVVEAQAAGLPCVISSEITNEVVILHDQVVQLPLALGPEQWATAAIEALDRGKFETKSSTAAMEETDFDIERGLPSLLDFYSAAKASVHVSES
jgi:glycosyltransferase involved in cell wall biosynthesis